MLKDIWGIIMIFKKLKYRQKVIVIVTIFVASIIISSVGGCQAVSYSVTKANYTCGKTMLPELVKYIKQDKDLNDANKAVRIEAVKGWLGALKLSYERVLKSK